MENTSNPVVAEFLHDNRWANLQRIDACLTLTPRTAIQHRTNITTILAQQGLPTPELDGWGYMLSNPNRIGV